MNKKNNNEGEKQSEALLLVPQSFLNDIAETQREILDYVKKLKPSDENVGDYITEAQAKKLLNKCTTWFWNKRTGGELAFTKVGGTIFYSKADILKLFDKSKTGQNNITANE